MPAGKEIEPHGVFPPYAPPRRMPNAVRYGFAGLAGALAAGMLVGVLPQGTVHQSADNAPPASAAPPPEQRVSDSVSVDVRMVADGTINTLSATTNPFALQIDLKECTPAAIAEVRSSVDVPEKSRILQIANTAIRSEDGTIDDPGALDVDCKSVSTDMPSEVVIHSVRTESIAEHIPNGPAIAKDLLTFTQSEDSVTAYENEIEFATVGRILFGTESKTIRLEFDRFTTP